MLFYGILGVAGQNLKFYAKNKSFWAVLAITIDNNKIGMFLAKKLQILTNKPKNVIK